MAGLLIGTPAGAAASDPTLWGAVPAYPGAARPLPTWERPRLAIALTSAPPSAVVAYYVELLTATGWRIASTATAEALAAAAARAPAWLPCTHPVHGRVDIQVSAGPHPKTGLPVTLIFYERGVLQP
ncbi:MAG: hypothetical protein VKQ33_02655 [Candidatus Sericytochromatia bacterium]|nr:hypothetical protein [Candidatus Sericytochromatia bacterium]